MTQAALGRGRGGSPRPITSDTSRPQMQHGQQYAERSRQEPHDRGPTTTRREASHKPWRPDPTPPHLTEVLPIPKQTLPEQPLEIHPELFWSLVKKASQRWNRGFDTMGSAGCFRLRSRGEKDTWIPNKHHVPQLSDRTMLIIPSPKSVKATLKRVIMVWPQGSRRRRRCSFYSHNH